jgi:hypothetical protein
MCKKAALSMENGMNRLTGREQVVVVVQAFETACLNGCRVSSKLSSSDGIVSGSAAEERKVYRRNRAWKCLEVFF